MKKLPFTGAGVAIITPFDESGQINFSETTKLKTKLTQLLSRERLASLPR